MKVSVVIPCYYSEATLAKVVSLTRETLVEAGYDYEFILVNDGSTDGTFAEIRRLSSEDWCVKGLDCLRNFGQHNAIMAGLNEVSGDLILLMDDDMQTHPAQCRILLDTLASRDCDVVFARYEEEHKTSFRRLGTRFAEWSEHVLARRPKDIYSSSFFVMKRIISDEVIRYPSPSVYVQGLIFRTTTSISDVVVKHFPRESGVSGYTFKALVRLWSTIINYSVVPLRFMAFVGLLLGVAGFFGAIVVIIQYFMDPTAPMGWPSIMVVLLIVAGLIMMGISLVGEYVGRLFMMMGNEPQYVIRTKCNLDTTRPPESEQGELHDFL